MRDVTKIQLPVNIIKPVSIQAAQPVKEKPLICISAKNFPEEVMELLFSYEKKEITGAELSKLLNESGYRTASGMLWHQKRIGSTLLIIQKYQSWKSRKEATEEQKSEPIVNQEKEQPPMQTQPQTTMDIQSFLNSIQQMQNENRQLKEENAVLQAQIEKIKSICAA